MRMKAVLSLLGLLLLAGCITPATTPPPSDLTPVQGVLGAAERSEGLTGTFRFRVLGTGWQRGWFYLNSQPDYRDQRCLTIALNPFLARQLQAGYGSNLDAAFTGKTVRVTGTAKRVTIRFMNRDGSPSEKYYFQTHVGITDLAQLQVLP
jgi:hypothetical protein